VRSFALPALILAIALAIAALKAYSVLTPPDVPPSVQNVVQHYSARGIKLGATIAEVRPKIVAPLTFVPHFGYVAHPQDASGVSELRLLLSDRDRALPAADGDRVEAVELVTAAPDAYTTIFQDLITVFPGAPTEGCLILPDDGNYREVRHWVTRDGRGGVALTNDFGGNRTSRHQGMVVVSLLAFSGPFAGGGTLRGNYVAESCARHSKAAR
jgi:hypothetical protein